VFTAIAFGFACSKYEHGPLITILSSFVAAFLVCIVLIHRLHITHRLIPFQFLLAFIVDIALYAFVKQQVDTLPNGNTVTSAGKFFVHRGELLFIDVLCASAFWMTFVSLILVLLSGTSVFFGRRRDVDASYPSYSGSSGGILSRFRKN
jgi:MFS superfamily sulfate permease-like transporter